MRWRRSLLPPSPGGGGSASALRASRGGVYGAQRRLFVSPLALGAIHPTPTLALLASTLPLQDRARRFLKAELARAGIGYRELAERQLRTRSAGGRSGDLFPCRPGCNRR